MSFTLIVLQLLNYNDLPENLQSSSWIFAFEGYSRMKFWFITSFSVGLAKCFKFDSKRQFNHAQNINHLVITEFDIFIAQFLQNSSKTPGANFGLFFRIYRVTKFNYFLPIFFSKYNCCYDNNSISF